MKTVCVTGHRPAKLPWKYKKEGPDYDEYIESLACCVAEYIDDGYEHFISGMALGVDMDFAETVIQFREHYDLDVKLECAIPCPNQTLKWSPAETARYKAILDKADKVTMVNDHYHLLPRTVKLSCRFHRYSCPARSSGSPCDCRNKTRSAWFARSICSWV